MIVVSLAKRFRNSAKCFLDISIERCRGVQSIQGWRFWGCLLAMIIAFCILARDPLFYDQRIGFQYGCGVLCIVVSYLTLSALFWDLLLFGKPQGINLFLQCCAFVPFTLFMARTFIKPVEVEEKSILGLAWEGVKFIEDKFGFSKMIGNILPEWLTDVFSHWSIAMVLLFIVVALCFKDRKCKIGLLFTAVFIGAAGAFATQVSWQYIAGSLALIVTFVLMYNPYEKQCFYYNWINRLSQESIHANELAVVTKVMSEAYDRGKLSYKEVAELIRSCFPNDKFDEDELHKASSLFVERWLLQRYNFVSLSGDSSGVYLKVNPRLLAYDSLTFALAIYPRRLIVAMLGVVWLVSPLDMVPDVIPFFGVLDDAVVAILSAKSIMTSRKDDVLENTMI